MERACMLGVTRKSYACSYGYRFRSTDCVLSTCAKARITFFPISLGLAFGLGLILCLKQRFPLSILSDTNRSHSWLTRGKTWSAFLLPWIWLFRYNNVGQSVRFLIVDISMIWDSKVITCTHTGISSFYNDCFPYNRTTKLQDPFRIQSECAA